MKRHEPLIEKEPPVEVADGKELIEKKLREELPLAGVKISKIVVEEENYERIGARRTVFENCRFLACDMERCEFSDVIFRRCDFSTQVCAKPEGEVYGLTPARCWKVKGRS